MANMRQGFQNVELIDKTIASIKEARCFNMASWDTCICGHIARVKGRECRMGFFDHAPEWGAMMLGIDKHTAEMLFGTHLDATRQEAVRVLEILRDEGVVDWRRACDEVSRDELDRMRIEAEAWEADHFMREGSYLDRLYERFEELCMKARSIT